MSDATQDDGTPDEAVRAAGLKVHGDKLEGLIRRDDARGAGGVGGVDDREARGARHESSSVPPRGAINSDGPDHASEPGSGGLMPGNYEQAGGEAGRGRGDPRAAAEAVRAPGSRVPDPNADPRLRREALDIASGDSHGGDSHGGDSHGGESRRGETPGGEGR